MNAHTTYAGQVAALASAIQEKAKEIHRMTSVTVSMQWKNLYH